MSYKDKVTMEAFKESGGIEYSADVLFGLQLEGLGNSGFDVDDAKSKNPRKIELKILKNRNGSTGTTVYFEYYPKFNYFKQGSQNFMDFNNAVDQKTTKKNR
jgi:replicative DNA helicase